MVARGEEVGGWAKWMKGRGEIQASSYGISRSWV